MGKKLKVLVVLGNCWNTNNSIGNSYANIFSGTDQELEIATLYCSGGVVNDSTVKHAYRITDKEVLMSILGSKKSVGSQVEVQNLVGTGETLNSAEKQLLSFARVLQWKIFFWGQELVWLLGKWNNRGFQEFVKNFAPDVVFVQIYPRIHMSRVELAVKKLTNAPMFAYVSDDAYTLKSFSLSPCFWLDRLLTRGHVKKVIDASEQLYVISDVQKKDYDAIFHKDCRVLTKGFEFSQMPACETPSKPYQLFYAGNIGCKRWKSLEKIGRAIQKINQNKQQMELTIYTATPITPKMKKALNIPGCIKTAGRISYEEVMQRQQQADILLHVEPTDLRNKFSAYHGFSTKIVDYMQTGKPILAYGLEMQASIAHLKENDAALLATNEEELEQILNRICENEQLLSEYGKKAWECGKKHHNIKSLQRMLLDDFDEALSH